MNNFIKALSEAKAKREKDADDVKNAPKISIRDLSESKESSEDEQFPKNADQVLLRHAKNTFNAGHYGMAVQYLRFYCETVWLV